MSYQPLDIERQPSRHGPWTLFGLSRRSIVLITCSVLLFLAFAGYNRSPYHQVNKIGSSVWLATYPDYVHGPPPLPEWLEALQQAKAASLIPDIPKATLNMQTGLGEYPADFDASKACSYRRNGCAANDDMITLPAHRWAINFDDGPLPPSKTLYDFLDKEEKRATHFWIGHNVKQHWPLAKRAADRGDHLAIHTWSHAHLTTYSDEGVIGELGWCMKIIEDLSGGRRPKYFRPPYGDIDNRVRALAKHVLGLTPIMWSADSADWTLNQTYASGDFVDPPYQGWTTQTSIDALEREMRDKTNADRGIIVLEHELSEESVEAFTRSYPKLKEHAWTTGAIPELEEGMLWYQ